MENKTSRPSFLQPAEIAAASLVFLFTYAALSKLLSFEQFRYQLQLQPFTAGQAGVLAFLLPAAELAAAVLLLAGKTRRAGLWLSLLLLFIFTSYVSLVLLGFWPDRPCPCGGVFSQLSWKGHFMVNLVFLLVAFGGLVFDQSGRRCGDDKW